MPEGIIDLLAVRRGTVTAPAGCGKTHLIADTLARHSGRKPVLVLTHTNAGVAALRGRLDRAGVEKHAYRLMTIDGWALRLLGLFPNRSAIDPKCLELADTKTDYPKIREAAAILMKSGHISDIVKANYARLLVDEYQDCNLAQHAFVYYTSSVLATVVLGDPMQSIFGWPGNELADWDDHVCKRFPLVGELTIPWRWRNAGTEGFGRWLLDARARLVNRKTIDLMTAPPEVSWVHLDGTEDRKRQIKAGSTAPPIERGSVLIVGNSKSPTSQQAFAGQIHGAVTVEAVELKDLIQFARRLDFGSPSALTEIVTFAGTVMTNVGATDFLNRVGVLERGTERKPPTDAERAAIRFNSERTPRAALDLLVEIGKQAGVRRHRPAILRACTKSLDACKASGHPTFYEAALHTREQNRMLGRALPGRAVGSTLLMKGLEADVSVILDARELDRNNLYVAMTRGSMRLVICSPQSGLTRA